jgi:hypothetical protein
MQIRTIPMIQRTRHLGMLLMSESRSNYAAAQLVYRLKTGFLLFPAR